MSFDYIGCCVGLSGRDITDMVDQSRQITSQTLRRRIGPDAWRDLSERLGYGDCPGLRLDSDYAVSFHTSRYLGRRCYYVVHSAIEYVFA